MLGDASICLRRLAYNQDKTLPEGASEARLVGTAYHAGLEEYYLARKTGVVEDIGALWRAASESFLKEIPEGWNAWDTSHAEAVAKAHHMLEQYLEQGHYWGYDHEVLEVEWRFEQPVPNTDLTIGGTADLVLRDPAGQIVIADHKTSGKGWQRGKETPRQKEQAPMYLYAWFLATGEVGSFSYDIMRYDGRFDRRIVRPSTNEIMRTVDKAMILGPILEDIKAGREQPPNTSHFLCGKYCDYYEAVCPFGKAMSGDV